ncbi:MAG: MBL fold metallo-hydrolase [Candidatus Odinarchaeia archaeon]
MKITPLAFESMGTRSMSTFIETSNVKILIDPGVALAPSRFGLPPHPIELNQRRLHWSKIVKYALKADILIITHYHYDHFNPFDDLNIYRNKILLTKHPKENINFSQKKRSRFFLDNIEGLPSMIEFSDGKVFTFGKTVIKFSKPVYHGTNPRLGYVTQVLIDDGERRLIHTSDIEGPCIDNQFNFIYENNPELIILDGPMIYMLGYRYSKKCLDISIENLSKIISLPSLKTLIIDHHTLRDIDWKNKFNELFHKAKKSNVKITTAAQYINQPDTLLEALRKELYERNPPSTYY